MLPVDLLRGFVNERLTAAAEEIFEVFKRTIVEYEDEINRQRRLLDIVWKPHVKLQRIEIPQRHVCEEEEVLSDQQLCYQERNSSLDQPEPSIENLHINLHKIEILEQHVCKEEEVLSDQQLCNQVKNSSLDQEDPQPPQIKKELEEVFTSQLELRQGTQNIKLTLTNEDGDNYEPETDIDHQLPAQSSPLTENQDPESSSSHGHSVSARKTKSLNHSSHSLKSSDNVCDPGRGKKSLKCGTHGEVFKEKLFSCKTCGKRFSNSANLSRHNVIHTGERPHTCETCGKGFRLYQALKTHMVVHTGERPYSCSICGRRFTQSSNLGRHMSIHDNIRPFSCQTCGKSFRVNFDLKVHMRTHTGDMPYFCSICGKFFRENFDLKEHLNKHTGVRPYSCSICGKRFFAKKTLNSHSKIHSGKKPL
ncbi:zinc finger protein 665-like [Cheilinus undulatus]|uniref:zinc finger protein 665-like n=1 Tax=Cheilinus undulatus TaxID=241271 RepID=UPI001BD6CC47|nr:zinc finger protein 665-like [Cheilinus undulatus]